MLSLRTLVAALWGIILIGAGVYVYSGGSLVNDMRHFVVQAPGYSFALFLLAYTIRPLILVPDSVMLMIGGVTFGPWLGILAGYIGENISALVAFSMARMLGNRWAGHSHIEFVRKLDVAIAKRGFRTLMFLRLIPIAPFDPINYGAGLTSMSYRTFIAGTALGVIPALVVYVLLGSAIADPRLIAVAVVLLAFIAIKLFAMRSVAPDIYALGTHHHRRKK